MDENGLKQLKKATVKWAELAKSNRVNSIHVGCWLGWAELGGHGHVQAYTNMVTNRGTQTRARALVRANWPDGAAGAVSGKHHLWHGRG